MPKAQSSRALNRDDFAYTPTPLSTVSKSALNATQNRATTAKKLMNENQTDGEEIEIQKNLRADFPRGDAEREKYRTKAGKKVTAYQWDVYDFILRIPEGKVTTYKIISDSIGGSARSAGGALKINPFSPYVPCHRVVASNLFIGGFFGQWAGRARESSNKTGTKKKEENDQPEIRKKIALLKQEGVDVDSRGFLQERYVWRPIQKAESGSE